MNNKTIFILIIMIAIPIGYFSYKTLKTRYTINNYLNQESWEKQRLAYNKEKRIKNASLFFGDSMTNGFKPYLTNYENVRCMGISGDFTEGLIKRIDNIIYFKPKNVFIMIGINDITNNVSLSRVKSNYLKIITLIENRCPETNIYIQSTLPTVGFKGLISSSSRFNNKVQNLNEFLREITKQRGINFIDMYSDFTKNNNELRKELTVDGIHLNKEGYLIWKSHIKKIITIQFPIDSV